VLAVVITGGSRGLGAALVYGLIARGDRVLALARSFDADQRVLAADKSDRLMLTPVDLTDPEALPTADDLAEFFAGADGAVLVNNAATIEPIGAAGELDPASVAAAVALNLTAPVLLTSAFLAAVTVRRQAARILFVSSSAAHRPKPGTAVYCATKAGAEMFFTTLRAELADRVPVEIVDPGGMDTRMHATARDATGVYFPDAPRLREVAGSGRLNDPRLVAVRILTDHLPAAGV
jgi:benzil reductase ((S)-benzoin forming)